MSLRNRRAICLSVGDVLALVACLREWHTSVGGMVLWLAQHAIIVIIAIIEVLPEEKKLNVYF